MTGMPGRTNHRLGILVLAAALACPAAGARAEAGGAPAPGPGGSPTLEGIVIEETSDTVVVALTGDGAFDTPRVRTSAGLVRVWLPGYFGAARLRRRGDGHRIRVVRTRPGAGQTALVLIRIGDRRTLPGDAVAVSRTDGVTRIGLPKSALPAPPPPPPPAAPPAAPLATAASEPPQPPPDPPTEEPRTVAPEKDAAAAAEAPGEEAGGDGFPWDEAVESEASGSPAASEELALGTASEPGAMTGPLLLLTLVLGLVYGGVRFLQSRNAPVPTASDIAVVATRRLGPKHQLVLVRALGRDHLLSVQGTTTRRLGTAPAPDPDALEASFGIPDLDEPPTGVRGAAGTMHPGDAGPLAGTDGDDDGPGLPDSTLASIRRDLEAREAGSAPGTTPPVGMAARGHLGSRRYASERAAGDELESRFGARLFEFALDQSRGTMARGEGVADDDDDLDEVVGRRRSMLGRIGLRTARGDRRSDGSPRGADSEAVAGLLRLRQRTGL